MIFFVVPPFEKMVLGTVGIIDFPDKITFILYINFGYSVVFTNVIHKVFIPKYQMSKSFISKIACVQSAIFWHVLAKSRRKFAY